MYTKLAQSLIVSDHSDYANGNAWYREEEETPTERTTTTIVATADGATVALGEFDDVGLVWLRNKSPTVDAWVEVASVVSSVTLTNAAIAEDAGGDLITDEDTGGLLGTWTPGDLVSGDVTVPDLGEFGPFALAYRTLFYWYLVLVIHLLNGRRRKR